MLRHFHGIWRARPDVRFEPGEVFADRLEMPRVNVVRLSRYVWSCRLLVRMCAR